MDELTLLRRTRDEIEPAQAVLHRGRAALLERIDRTGELSTPVRSRTSRRRRRFAVGGLSALGAAALVAGLVVTDVVGLAGWRGGAEAAAATVLKDAAASAITAVDPAVGAGKYLQIRTTALYLSSGQVDDRWASYQHGETRTLYVPADRADDWVWERGPITVVETFGEESKAVADAWQAAVNPDSMDSGDLLRAPGGAFYGGSAGAGHPDLDDLPRDPYRLLNHIYRVTLGAGPSPDTEALVFIADRLRIGTVPAELRAAMYEAAAMIPGVEFVENQAALNGRPGVAIGRVEPAWGTRVDIIVDPDTGAFIGDREVLLESADGVPAGTALRWSEVTTTVVDEAPDGGTVCGKIAVNPETGQC
jgi:hypothetical protein